jgi:hypothetical protein
LENIGIDGRVILKRIFKKQYGAKEGVDFIDLAEDRCKGQALVNVLTI